MVMDYSFKSRLVKPFRCRTRFGAADLTARLRTSEPLPHVARFGDGEIQCCLGWPVGRNCDKHPYTPELADALIHALRYFVTESTLQAGELWLGNWFYWPFGAWLHGVVESFGDWSAWCSHDTFAHVLLPQFGSNTPHWERLEVTRDLYLAVRECPRRKVIIGRRDLRQLCAFFRNIACVDAPARNGWASINDVAARSSDIIRRDDLVLIAFGMASKPLMARLLETDPSATYWDVGAGLDPLVQAPRSRRNQPKYEDLKTLYGDTLP